MHSTHHITGIILSGGQSRRMGREKGLIPLLGKPLIAYAINLLKDVCGSVMIGANDEAYRQFGFPVVKDEHTGIGPAGGILSCLKASPTEGNFVLSCDMPLVSEGLVRWILDNRGDADAAIPFQNGFPEPLCGYYSKKAGKIFEKATASGIYKLQDILGKLTVNYLDAEENPDICLPHIFENINTTGDLHRMETLMKQVRP